MPFKLRLKKSRHYNVITKSLFVICVELLDGTNIECSLSAESLGSSCLEYVCQRLGLQQSEFFGLCYMSRNGISKWVEMSRPLKKQLDKYAANQNLYLRVMYYVNGVSLITDETTRNHYFLQLKKDVIEGRISCRVEEAVRLASFSMQAEFGNHDMERHTAEYLKDFVIFPQHIMENGHMQLYEAVVQHHAALAGLPQAAAEEQYILLTQRLDGYGQETFLARDSTRNEAVLGVSLTGVLVGYENPPSCRVFPWRDISNVINHKRNFVIECQSPEDNVQLEFSDPDSAKYVWKLCVLQHTFYMQYVQNAETSSNRSLSVSVGGNVSIVRNESDIDVNQFFAQTGEARMTRDSMDDLDHTGAPDWMNPGRAQSTSCLDLTAHTDLNRLRALLPSYRPAPDYETAVQHKYMQQSAGQSVQTRLIYSSQPEIHQAQLHETVAYAGHRYPDVAQVERIYVEREPPTAPPAMSFHTYSTPELDKMETHLLASLQLLQLYKAPPPYRDTAKPNSSSTPDLASQTHRPLRTTNVNPQVSGSSPDLVSSRHLTPGTTYADALSSHPAAHRTYTNLAALTHAQLPYHVPAPEPIYENIPLPWREEEAVVESCNIPPVDVTVHANETSVNLDDISTVTSSAPTTDTSVNSTSTTTTDNTSSTLDSSGKSKTWKRWAILGKGKSNTLQKARPRSQVARDHPHRWSTGLPRLPLPPTISKETMCQLLERKLADSQLFHEFEKIPKKKPNPDLSTAQHPDNAAFNRHKDVLPYEENRVRLTPTRENKMGYVNASHITATVGTNQRFYVAAQGPMSNTVDSFWQTVWETDVYLVVQLTTLQEEGAVNYLPLSSDHCLRVQKFQIWREFSQETGHCMTSRLRLVNSESRRSRFMWHLQYTAWGDHGCPSSPTHFLGFLEELNSVRQHTTGDIPAGHNTNPPVLVHCNAGVGRTGVAIVCDLLLYTLDHNQEVDIPRVVALLRHQRMLMVQTVAQYRFIYSLLINYLKQSRLI